MSKLDFSSLNDAELLKQCYFAEMELEAALVNMVNDGSLDLIYKTLDELEDEKEKRGLNG